MSSPSRQCFVPGARKRIYAVPVILPGISWAQTPLAEHASNAFPQDDARLIELDLRSESRTSNGPHAFAAGLGVTANRNARGHSGQVGAHDQINFPSNRIWDLG